MKRMPCNVGIVSGASYEIDFSIAKAYAKVGAISSDQIFRAVWNEEDGPYDTVVRNAVSKIRKKLN